MITHAVNQRTRTGIREFFAVMLLVGVVVLWMWVAS